MQIIFDNLWQLRTHVNQGTFIKYYFKPINMLFCYISEIIDLKGFGYLFFGIGAFIWSSIKLGIVWTPIRLIFLPISIISSSVILISMMLIAASATFWVKDSFSILSLMTSLRDHSRYPIGIYNNVFKFIFTLIIPFGFMAFYPSQFFLKDKPLDIYAWGTPFVGALLFFIAIKLWNKGVKIWGGTGT